MENASFGALGFRFRLQLDLSIGEFDRVFHAFAVVLLANLFGLFLNERSEGIEVAGDVFPGFFLGRNQSVVEPLNLLALSLIDAVEREFGAALEKPRCPPPPRQPDLHRKPDGEVYVHPPRLELLEPRERVLRAAIPFFSNARLLPPKSL